MEGKLLIGIVVLLFVTFALTFGVELVTLLEGVERALSALS